MPGRLIILACLALPNAAVASWLEFCDLEGEIVGVTKAEVRGEYAMDLRILAASRDETGPHRGYTDCSEHLGQTMQVALAIPVGEGEPAPGDRVAFNRSAIDVFGPNGYAGTSVRVGFRALHRAE